jgi:hypothetical protein
MIETEIAFANPISPERISELKNEKNIDSKVASVDLEMVKKKLQVSDEGEGWTIEQCDSAEIEYKRYLNLCLTYGKGIVPNKIMDTFWHYHILDTLAYHKDCQDIFGYYLHHFPYFGMRSEKDAVDLKNAFEKTKELYFQTFREEMDRDSSEMKCWHSCQSRCWHACSSK